MAFVYNEVTYTPYYVDVNGSSGDGSSPAQSANVLPGLNTISANTAVIIRRTNTITISTNALTNSNANIMLLGSPKQDDAIYDFIPDASVWESDVEERVTFLFTMTTIGPNFSGTNIFLQRIQIYQTLGTANNTIANGMFTLSGSGGTVIDCRFQIQDYDYDNPYATARTRRGLCINGNNASIESCYIDTRDAGILLVSAYASNLTISNCIVRTWDDYCIGFSGGGLTSAQIKSCDFYSKNDVGLMSLGTSSPSAGSVIFSYCNMEAENIRSNTIAISSTLFITMLKCNIRISYNVTANASFIDASNTMLFKDCKFETFNETFSASYKFGLFTSSGATRNFINCIFDVDGEIGANSTNTGNNIFSGCTFIRGAPFTHQPLFVDSIYCHSRGTSLVSRDGGVLYANTVTMDHSTTKSISLSENSLIFINDLDIALGDGPNYNNIINFNNSNAAAIYVKNEAGVSGNWTARNRLTEMKVTNTYRSGGNNFGIFCKSYGSATPKPYLVMAPAPFSGIPVVFGTPGYKNVILYFADKLFDPASPVSLLDLVMEVDAPENDVDDKIRVYSTSTNGKIVSDSSIWNNDPGLSVKRLQIKIYMPVAGTAYCRVSFHKYQSLYSSGYLVFDSNIVGESA
jgi:hypothetical protein